MQPKFKVGWLEGVTTCKVTKNYVDKKIKSLKRLMQDINFFQKLYFKKKCI